MILTENKNNEVLPNDSVCVQVWGKEENLKDLLSEVATGSLQDGQSPGVYLCEDPICGMQVHTHMQTFKHTAAAAALDLIL